jgi:hypothetical protein
VREFRDLAGVQWSVFRAIPHSAPSKREKILPETFRLGWLVFECERERRRLAPVPENWEALTDHELELLCMRANVVPARPSRGRVATDAAAITNAATPAASREPDSPAQSPPVRATQMQELLAQVLDEVCDQPHAQSLDTGELVRVEEALVIAAHAAREAVALRRATREHHGG